MRIRIRKTIDQQACVRYDVLESDSDSHLIGGAKFYVRNRAILNDPAKCADFAEYHARNIARDAELETIQRAIDSLKRRAEKLKEIAKGKKPDAWEANYLGEVGCKGVRDAVAEAAKAQLGIA